MCGSLVMDETGGDTIALSERRPVTFGGRWRAVYFTRGTSAEAADDPS